MLRSFWRHRTPQLYSRHYFDSKFLLPRLALSSRADMDAPAAAKRTHEDGDAPEPKRVKTSEEMETADGEVKAEGQTTSETPAPDAGNALPASGPKGKRDAAGFPKSRKGKEKDTKNTGRRRRTRNEEALEDGVPEASGEPKTPRLPKRMCALLIGFCGSGYSGMQM